MTTEEKLRQLQFLIITSEGKMHTVLYDDLVKLENDNVKYTFLKNREIPICQVCSEQALYFVDWDNGKSKCCTCGFSIPAN